MSTKQELKTQSYNSHSKALRAINVELGAKKKAPIVNSHVYMSSSHFPQYFPPQNRPKHKQQSK